MCEYNTLYWPKIKKKYIILCKTYSEYYIDNLILYRPELDGVVDGNSSLGFFFLGLLFLFFFESESEDFLWQNKFGQARFNQVDKLVLKKSFIIKNANLPSSPKLEEVVGDCVVVESCTKLSANKCKYCLNQDRTELSAACKYFVSTKNKLTLIAFVKGTETILRRCRVFEPVEV